MLREFGTSDQARVTATFAPEAIAAIAGEAPGEAPSPPPPPAAAPERPAGQIELPLGLPEKG